MAGIMFARRCEMTLGEAMSDPLIRQIMAADGVDPRNLASNLNEIARQLESRSAPPSRCVCV